MRTGTYYIHRERQPLQIFLQPSLFSSFSEFFTLSFIIFIQFIQPKIVPVLMMEVSAFLYAFLRLCHFNSNHTGNWHNSKSPFALVFVVSPYQCLFEHVLPFITSSIAAWTTPTYWIDILLLQQTMFDNQHSWQTAPALVCTVCWIQWFLFIFFPCNVVRWKTQNSKFLVCLLRVWYLCECYFYWKIPENSSQIRYIVKW